MSPPYTARKQESLSPTPRAKVAEPATHAEALAVELAKQLSALAPN